MYVRPPNLNRQKIKVPENYSGSTFGVGRDYNDMPPPVRQMPNKYDLPPNRDCDLPQDDQEYISYRSPEPFETPTEPTPDINERIEDHNKNIAEVTKKTEKKDLIVSASSKPDNRSSLFSLLLPPGSSQGHFPFGHGLGSEELLILGIMLLVFLHGNENGAPDNEFLLLLGLLLFAG